VERNSGRPGAAFAPSAIRRAFTRLATAGVAHAVRSGALCIVDAGDIDVDGKTLEQIHDAQTDVVTDVLEKGHIPIVMGGGHDTAWPTINALNMHLESYGVINIDAHADVRPLLDGSRAHSGSPFRQMLEDEASQLAPGAFVEFGLQHASVSEHHVRYVIDKGMTVFMLEHIRAQGLRPAWQDALNIATEAAKHLYVSFDMDAVSSAYAPGVSAPASDGFTASEAVSMVLEAARHPAFKMFDVVEVNPEHDVDGRTAKLASTLIATAIRGIAERV
jgi:formimidoylglutamase